MCARNCNTEYLLNTEPALESDANSFKPKHSVVKWTMNLRDFVGDMQSKHAVRGPHIYQLHIFRVNFRLLRATNKIVSHHYSYYRNIITSGQWKVI